MNDTEHGAPLEQIVGADPVVCHARHAHERLAHGWVYAVHDDAGAVVYVGQTNDTPAVRYRGHLRNAMGNGSAPFLVWLRSMIDAGSVPRLSTLEQPPLEELDKREQFWIRHFAKLRGGDLLNAKDRGDGLSLSSREKHIRTVMDKIIGVLEDRQIPMTLIVDTLGLIYEGRLPFAERAVDTYLVSLGYERVGAVYQLAGFDYGDDDDLAEEPTR